MVEVHQDKKPCILAVDDDRLILAMLAIGMRKAGYELLQASSAEEALDVLSKNTPDLALLDISMPGMSGIELGQHLHDKTTIPFMFLSSHKEVDIVRQATQNGAVGYLVKPIDVTQIIPAIEAGMARAEEIKQLRHSELDLNSRLDQAQEQLVQHEKLASIGQLAAGVAHEINNPIGYVHSNIKALEEYIGDLFQILDAYDTAESIDSQTRTELEQIKSRLNLCFLREDIPALLGESKEGILRVRKIVHDLKDFSRVDHAKNWQWADLHQGLDSTLNMANNEIKYKADVVKEYGELPPVECLPAQLNQVFMNLLMNAAHAINGPSRGTITVRTGCEGDQVWIEVSDNGSGISAENQKHLFTPFFTTKPIGKGTGLGLSLSYEIVKKHGGDIEVESTEGVGTTFRVILPQHQTHAAAMN